MALLNLWHGRQAKTVSAFEHAQNVRIHPNGQTMS